MSKSNLKLLSLTIPGKPDKPTNLASVVKTWESIKLKWDAGFDGGYIQSFFISVRSVFGERIYEVLPSAATEYNVSSKYRSAGMIPRLQLRCIFLIV